MSVVLLKAKGFVTAVASNGLTGLQVAKHFHPDLVLCDVDIPELNGYEVLKKLRQDPDLGCTPFIFLAALTSIEDLRKGMNLGADDYLTKPFKVDDLLAAIADRLYKQANLQVATIHSTIPEQQNSEKLRLTPRQQRILQIVNQGKPLHELAYELGTSRDAAQLLEGIAIRLNQRLNLNYQPEEKQSQQKPKPPQKKETSTSIDHELLTPRQSEVLRLVANGLTTKEIAKSLFISVKTVETHRGQIMQRLNVHDLVGLIRYALRVGLIDLDED